MRELPVKTGETKSVLFGTHSGGQIHCAFLQIRSRLCISEKRLAHVCVSFQE